MSAARTRSAPISSGRRAERSTRPPASSPTNTPGATPSADSTATCAGVARRVRMATIGSAVRVTRLPSALAICAPHSRRKSGCRHSPPEGHPRIIQSPVEETTARRQPERHEKTLLTLLTLV